MSIMRTEPRHLPAVPEPTPEQRYTGMRDQLVSVLIAIPTVWLFLATWLLHYPSDHAMNVAQVNEMSSAIVLAFAVLARLSRPRGAGSDLLVFVMGAWVAMSPYVLDYGTTPVTNSARTSDLVAGLSLVGLAAISYGLRRAARRAGRQTAAGGA